MLQVRNPLRNCFQKDHLAAYRGLALHQARSTLVAFFIRSTEGTQTTESDAARKDTTFVAAFV